MSQSADSRALCAVSTPSAFASSDPVRAPRRRLSNLRARPRAWNPLDDQAPAGTLLAAHPLVSGVGRDDPCPGPIERLTRLSSTAVAGDAERLTGGFAEADRCLFDLADE